MTSGGQHGIGPAGSDDDSRTVLPDTTRLPRGGSGPLVVAALVAAAFVVGLVRPWDWLAATPAPGDPAGDPGTPTRAVAAGEAGGTAPSDTGRPAQPAPLQEPTCAYPRSWRLATIQDWAGRGAHVWTAASAVPATGPGDPAIPFMPVISRGVTAIGWCAPIDGPERPPLAATGTLFRLQGDGTAREIAHDRLEPAAPDALGELWVPVPQGVGRRPAWLAGRYVIRLRAPGGSYERYLGIEIVTFGQPDVGPVPSPVPSESPGRSPQPSGSPDPSP